MTHDIEQALDAMVARVSQHAYAEAADVVSKWDVLQDMADHPTEWIELLQQLQRHGGGKVNDAA